MIVKCENCQTRFKIPDDKVTEKGVKVRCTKCSHTFRVKLGPGGTALIVPAAPSSAPPVAGKAVPDNPFSQFAPPVGEDMFSKETRVAPVPTRREATGRAPAPSAAPLRGASAPEVTARASPPREQGSPGFHPGEVTRRAAAPADPLAVAFGLDDSGARTDPAAVYGGRGPQTNPAVPQAPATTEPAAVYGGRSPQITPAASQAPVTADRHTSATDPAAFGGSAPPAPVPPARSAPVGDALHSSGPESGGFPVAEPAPPAPDRSLFDIPPPPPEPAPRPELEGLAALGAPAPELASIARASRAVAASGQSSSVIRPAGRPEDARGLEEREAPGRMRRLSGVLANLAVAALLVALLVVGGAVYLNEGRLDLDTLSPGQIAALLTERRAAILADVSNGLYETRSGRSVFFIRGVVHNRTGAPMSARVRAEILDGKELVRAAEGMAGATPTPEELHGLSSAADQARLTERLNQEARPVPPGAGSPFFLLFNFGDVQSPDLANYRLRVTVTGGPAMADAAAAP